MSNENVSLIPKFTTINNSMAFYRFNEDDLENYAVKATEKCYYFIGAPEFYEIWDNFIEEIMLSAKTEFYMQGTLIRRGWIKEDTLALLLEMLRIEYISFDGTVYNECQNIINAEWMMNYYGHGKEFRIGENNTLMLQEFHGEQS